MENHIKKKFARFLKEKRAALGLTYIEFSSLIYGTKNKDKYLCLLEKEKRHPNLETLNFICKKLNTDINLEEH